MSYLDWMYGAMNRESSCLAETASTDCADKRLWVGMNMSATYVMFMSRLCKENCKKKQTNSKAQRQCLCMTERCTYWRDTSKRLLVVKRPHSAVSIGRLSTRHGATNGVQNVLQLDILDWNKFKIYTPVKRIFLPYSYELGADVTSL